MNVRLLVRRCGANGQETARSEYFWNWIKTILERERRCARQFRHGLAGTRRDALPGRPSSRDFL